MNTDNTDSPIVLRAQRAIDMLDAQAGDGIMVWPADGKDEVYVVHTITMPFAIEYLRGLVDGGVLAADDSASHQRLMAFGQASKRSDKRTRTPRLPRLKELLASTENAPGGSRPLPPGQRTSLRADRIWRDARRTQRDRINGD